MLKIVQKSDNKTLGSKLNPGLIYGSYGRDARINFREGSFDWKLKGLVHILRVKSDRRVAIPPGPFFPQTHLIKILR